MGEGTKSNLRAIGSGILKFIPTTITVGSIVFASGQLYADVKDIKDKVGKVEVTEVQQAALTVEVRGLQAQIQQSRETQKETNVAVGNLADAVQKLSVAVAKQEGRNEKRK